MFALTLTLGELMRRLTPYVLTLGFVFALMGSTRAQDTNTKAAPAAKVAEER